MINSIDVIIPLGSGSKSNNDELRILLRSFDKYAIGLGKIIIVSESLPDWLTGVEHIELDDPYKHNKDANIIRKVLAGLESVTGTEFVWTCDDFALLEEVDLTALPPVTNNRGKDSFSETGTIWQRRVWRTFEYLESRNIHLTKNFEAHVAQRFPVQKLKEVMAGVPYGEDIGYSINTLFYGLLGVYNGVNQKQIKNTCETKKWELKPKKCIGWNDKAFLHGLKKELFKKFPESSRWEKF